MSELRACIEAVSALRAQQATALVATVVDVHGSSYRKRGARMVFSEERWLAGSVSGGCLERDVLRKGGYQTRHGRAHLTRYDAASDERSGSGCDGVIDVLVERAAPSAEELADPLNFAARCLRDERWGLFATVFRSGRSDVRAGEHLALFADGELHSQLVGTFAEGVRELLERHLGEAAAAAASVHVDGVDLLLERIAPPLHLFVFGGAHDVPPVVTLAKALGWTVSVCEPHAQLSSRERFRVADHHRIGPLVHALAAIERCVRPAALVMGHHYERDLAALDGLLRTRVPYVGVLGACSRAARLREDLRARGHLLDDAAGGRLHAPVGLAIGAESPQEIALAIIAEIQAELGTRMPLARLEPAWATSA